MPKVCTHPGCNKRPSYGKVGSNKAECCAEHAVDGMVDVRNKRCVHSECTKYPSYGKVGGKAELCAEHAKEGMVSVRKKRCGHSGCIKQPSYGEADGKAELCSKHAEDGMVDVRNKRCGHSGCITHPSYGNAGGKAELCAEHAQDGMVDVRSKRCGHSGCIKGPSYGKTGRKAELCAEHAVDGMVDVRKKRCVQSGCTKLPSYGKASGKAELCAEHSEDGMVNVAKSKRCVHSGCTKQPSYGKAGRKAELRAGHAEGGMVAVRRKRCGHRGCNIDPTYGTAESHKKEFCANHAKAGMACLNITSRSSGKGRVGDASPGNGTAGRASAVEKRSAPPSILEGASSGSRGRGGTKRRRVAFEAVGMRLPSSPRAAAAVVSEGARRGNTVVGTTRAATAEMPYLDPSGAVKAELEISSKAEPSEAIVDRNRWRAKKQTSGAGGGKRDHLSSEQDSAVKPELAVSCPSDLMGRDSSSAKDLIDLSGEPARKREKARRAKGAATGPCLKMGGSTAVVGCRICWPSEQL